MIKKLLKFILAKLNLQRISVSSSLSLEAALERICYKDIKIQTVIDIGAYNGSWSKIARQYFPESFYYLVEANPFHQQSLEKFKSSSKNINFTLAAAGDINGELYFDASDPFGGLATHQKANESDIRVPVVTINSICDTQKLQAPFLLKLDTHGFEIPIFEGASEILDETNLIIVETYNFGW